MPYRGKRGGQAIVLVTLALIAMCGLMGLAVDLGWSFYVHKTARAAADSAALGAAKQALANLSGAGPWQCTTPGITCHFGLIDCSAATGNLLVGCQYAEQNGFSVGGQGGRQGLRIEALVPDPGCTLARPPTCVPTAPGVAAYYWVHVVATQTIPQLFSSVLGNTEGVVSADATAAILTQVVPGDLVLLNRVADTGPGGVGVNLSGGGSPSLAAPDGIVLASSAAPAATFNGSPSITAPFTYIEGSGTANAGSGAWTATPQNGFADLTMFQDPESGKGHTPLNFTQSSRPYIAIPGGSLTTTICNPCPSGNYYATSTSTGQATGAPILVGNNVSFEGGNFGDFMFFGGVSVGGSVTFGPGRYVLAGVLNGGTSVLDTTNATNITGGVNQSTDAGRIFILTDSSYGGDASMAAVVAGIPNKTWSSLQAGPATLSAGTGTTTIYGLNESSWNLPAGLKSFAPLAIWQDQRNSTIQYNARGDVINSVACGGDGGVTACPNTLANSGSPQLDLWASGNLTMNGAIYQPRGAWTVIHSSSSATGPLRIVTGAIDLQGSPNLNLSSPSNPVTRLTATLVR